MACVETTNCFVHRAFPERYDSAIDPITAGAAAAVKAS